MAVNTPQRRARFNRRASMDGVDLGLIYKGQWERDAQTGMVGQGTAPHDDLGVRGFVTLGRVASAWETEYVQKLGRSWQSSGQVLLPATVPVDGLESVTDKRDGTVYTVLLVAPLAWGEDVYRMVAIRRAPIYDRRVTIHTKKGVSGGDVILMRDAPARISFRADGAEGGMAQVGGGAGLVADASPVLEMPHIVESDSTDPPDMGVSGGPAPGTRLVLSPKQMFVTDNPALYGGGGPSMEYVLASQNLDPGGEDHHQRYLLSYKPL